MKKEQVNTIMLSAFNFMAFLLVGIISPNDGNFIKTIFMLFCALLALLYLRKFLLSLVNDEAESIQPTIVKSSAHETKNKTLDYQK